MGLAGIDDARALAWAVADRRAVVTGNIRDFTPLHALHLTTETAHHGIVLVPASRYSLRRAGLGPLIQALDQLLAGRPADDALRDTEHFL